MCSYIKYCIRTNTFFDEKRVSLDRDLKKDSEHSIGMLSL